MTQEIKPWIKKLALLLCGNDESRKVYVYGSLGRLGWTASEQGWVNADELAQIIATYAPPIAEALEQAAWEAGRNAAARVIEQVAKEVGRDFWETHRLNTGLMKALNEVHALRYDGGKP